MHRFKRADIIGFFALGLSAASQFFLSPVVINYMGVEGLGMWHLLFQTFMYLQIVDLGLSNGIVREIAAVKIKAEQKNLNDTCLTAKRGLAVTGLAFAMLGGSMCLFLPRFIEISQAFRIDFLIALGLLSFWGFFRYRYSLSLLGLRATNRIVAFNSMELINGPGRPLLGISFLVFKMGLTGIAIGYILVEMMVRLISNRIQDLPVSAGKFSRRQLMKMVTFGGATSIVSLSTLIIYFSSSFIVGWILGVKEVAVYQSTIALPFLILRFAIIPFNNLLPSFIFDYERGKTKILFLKSRHSHTSIMLYCLILMIFICLINRQFVSLWVGKELFAGNKFSAAYCVFLFLSVARHNGYIMYQSTGKLKPIVIGHLIEIPLNIGLSIVLTDKLGLSGIAYAYILGTIPVTFISQIPFFLFRLSRTANADVPPTATRFELVDKSCCEVSKRI